MTDLQDIILKAYEGLPNEKKSKPWSFVNHGVGLLNNEDELNCYLAAYGKMHEEKIHSALTTLTNIQDIVQSNYQIIDWGCGQGLATLCFLDFIKNYIPYKKPKNITLIEPSNPAITKAKKYIEANIQGINTHLIEKKLDDVDLFDVNITEAVSINFFSNILDIETVNLEKLTELIKNNLKGEQYFICVGPMNATSTRIDIFAKLLNCTDEQLIGKENGKLKTTRGTIKLLVFKIKVKEIEIIKTIYYPPIPKNNNMMHLLDKKLNAILPHILTPVEKIIEYYKVVVELEQLKEPAIENYYSYEYGLNNNNEFVIDLESNITFLNVFKKNITEKWPKNLSIAFEIEIDGRKHAILNYTYLIEDIKGIDTVNEKVKLKLSDFELNYSTLSRYEKSEKQIDEIENLIKEKDLLEDVFNIFKEKVDNKIVFDNKLSFALSSKNPALLQIYAELKKLNKHFLKENDLLFDFLFNNSIDNKIGDLTGNDLIQITNLDDSQKKAVLTAFNNKVSVITGPPGSGKTQVISNILANAVMQNKKVLVASKNNQAVDNAKSRFDREEENGFFLRFGSKEVLTKTTKPTINRFITLQPTLQDNSIQLKESNIKLHEILEIKKKNEKFIENRNKFQGKLPEYKKKLENLQTKFKDYSKKNANFEVIRLNNPIEVTENYIAISKKSRNNFEVKYSGLNKLWIDWFTKKKYGLELVSFIDETNNDFKKLLNQIPNEISLFKNGSKIIESYNNAINSFNLVTAYYAEHSNIKIELQSKTDELKKIEDYINSINLNEQKIKQTILDCEPKIIIFSKEVLKAKIENKLFNASVANINRYNDYLPDDIPWRNEDLPPFIKATKEFLEIFNIISVTSLSAKASLPLTKELFDMVVIDEASQCDIASAIPLILRAKQVVVIGDPLQLKHITSLNKFEEEKIKNHLHLSGSVYLKYKEKSLWDYSASFLINAKNSNKVVNIENHYRCHPDIFGYSNEFFYIPRLGIELKICTKKEDFKIEPSGIKWINIVGTQKADNININQAEIEKAVDLAVEAANSNPDISIGIVTPFRHQAKEIHEKIPTHLKTGSNPRIIANTVNIFQGAERDVMIYSLVVTDNSPDSKIYWIDNMVPESVNVAVSRARNTIYIVGNKNYIRRTSSLQKPLGQLLNYIEKLEN